MRLSICSMAMDGKKARTVPCPGCRQPAVYGEQNPWRPFCSQRCRNVDLGAWASEQFRVPADGPEAPHDDDPAAPQH